MFSGRAPSRFPQTDIFASLACNTAIFYYIDLWQIFCVTLFEHDNFRTTTELEQPPLVTVTTPKEAIGIIGPSFMNFCERETQIRGSSYTRSLGIHITVDRCGLLCSPRTTVEPEGTFPRL
jgi:hypothetical protein